VSKLGKGKPVPAVVDAVINAGMLRISLLPDGQPLTLSICGVRVRPPFFKPPPPLGPSFQRCGHLPDALTACTMACRRT
jgi:hypothetical protein